MGSIYEKDCQQPQPAVSHLIISSGDAEALNTIYYFLRQYEPSQPIPEDVQKLYLGGDSMDTFDFESRILWGDFGAIFRHFISFEIH